jgi:RHS repeat-associated protein
MVSAAGPLGFVTVAGGGEAKDGPATSAGLALQFSDFYGQQIAVDQGGNIFILEDARDRVLRVDASTGGVSVVAGGRGEFSEGAAATSVKLELSAYSSIAVDNKGGLFLASYYGGKILKVDLGIGTIRTYAGGCASTCSSNDGIPATSSNIEPASISTDSSGNLYIADSRWQVIRRIDAASGFITTVAGQRTLCCVGGFSGDGGPATNAQLYSPRGVVVDPSGNIFIADSGNNRVRRVDSSTGIIQTIAGGGSSCSSSPVNGAQATAVCLSDVGHLALGITSELYLNMWGVVYRIDLLSGTIAAIDRSSGNAPSIGGSLGLAVDRNGFLLGLARPPFWPFRVSGAWAWRLDVRTKEAVVVAGSGWWSLWGDRGPAAQAVLENPMGVAVDGAGNLFIADSGSHRVRRVAAESGTISSVAGSWDLYGLGGDGNGGPATNATIFGVRDVAIDARGNLLIARAGRIQRVDAETGLISIVAGGGTAGVVGDGGLATTADLKGVSSIAVDADGTMFIAETDGGRVRRIGSDGIISTVANVSGPTGIAIDPNGSLIVASRSTHRVVRVAVQTGVVSALAGTGTPGLTGDGGVANAARLNGPTDVAVDAAGNVFIADSANLRVRRVDGISGLISSVVDTSVLGSKAENAPAGVAVDLAGNLYVTTAGQDTDILEREIPSGRVLLVPSGSPAACAEMDPVAPSVAAAVPAAATVEPGVPVDAVAPAGGAAQPAPVVQAASVVAAGRMLGGVSTKAVFGRDVYGRSERGVNASIQSLVMPARDVSVAGVGPSLELVRTYNSADTRSGMFGRGWTSTFEERVFPNVLTGCATVIRGDGRREFYLANTAAPGFYFTPRGYSSTLTGGVAAGWVLTDADGTRWSFRGSDGRLTTITDAQGQSLVLAWDAASQLTSVRDAVSSRELVFTNANGRVTSVSTSPVSSAGGSAARLTWKYGYSGEDLIAVCDARNNDLVSGLCTRYSVSITLGVITQVKDARNKIVKRVGYQNGKVAWEENAYGNRTSFVSRSLVGGSMEQSASCSTAVSPFVETKTTDPRGNVTTSTFDSCYRLVSLTDAAGGVTRYEYDAAGFRSKVTDPNGLVTARTYDARGNVLSETNGAGETSWFAYDAFNNLLSARDGRSASSSDNTFAVTLTWDAARRNLLSQSTPVTAQQATGTTQRWTYTTGSEVAVGGGTMPAGLVRTEVDPRGRTTTYSYDRVGNLREVVDRVGLRTAYAYDELGRRVSQTVFATGFAAGVTTSYVYDALGNVVRQDDPAVTDAVSGVTRRKRMVATIDAAGNATQVVESDIGGSATPTPSRTTQYAFDDANRLVLVTDPVGGVTSTVYDVAGNVMQVTDPRGVVRVSEYDALNRVVRVTAKAVVVPEGGTVARDVVELQVSYDAGGRVATRTDAAGRVTRFAYDSANRMTTETLVGFVNPTGTTRNIVLTAVTYDKAGNPTRVVTGGGLLTENRVFDQAGRLVSVTEDPTGANRITRLTYDANGNVVRRVVSRGGRSEEVRFVVDAGDRVTSRTVENGAVDLVTSFGYDNRGVKVWEVDPRGNVAGAVAAGFTVSFTPDALGRVVRVQSPVVTRSEAGVDTAGLRPERVFGFDAFGQQVSVRDERGFVTAQVFDGLGRVTRVTYPSYTPPGGVAVIPVEVFGFDGNGNVVSRTDRRGQTTSFVFDGLNRVVRQTDPKVGAAAAGVVSVGYDDVGNMVWRVDQRGARSRWSYDGLNRVVSEVREVRQPSLQSFTARFGYDDLGNRVSVTDAVGNVTRFEYSRLGEQTAVVDPANGRSVSVFDVAGRVTSVTDPLGRRMETVFDVAGRATTVRRVGSTGTVVWSMTQGWDAAGNRVSVTSPRGNVPNAVAAQFTTSFGYDAVNRLVSVTEPVTGSTTRSTGYGYDLAGNTTRVTDGRGNVSWYGFNEWGVQTTVTEPLTTAHPNLSDRQWVTSLDAGGLPVRTVEPGGVSVTRVFDELGRLVSETGSGTGVVSASRTFGWDAGGLRTSAGTAGGNIVFGYDDRGLLTSVTGPAGFAGSSFTYDGAGRMLSRTDAAGTTQFTWNSRNLPATMRDGLTAQTATFTWDAAAQLTGVDYSGGGRRRFVYDQAGRVTSDQLSTSAGTVTAGYSYEWDADSNLTARTVTLPGNTGAGVNRYGYDNAGRLTSWTRPNNSTLTYAWDAAGNLTGNAGVAQTFDQRNRMLSSGSTTYMWSARGTLTSQKVGTAAAVPVVFDGLGRQTGFGSQSSVFDSLDRVVTHAGLGFSYAGVEFDPVKVGAVLLARGPGGGLLAAKNGTAAAVLAGLDQHGDVGLWMSGAGAVTGSRTYTPLGAPVASTGTWAAPVGFQGDYTDTTSTLTWMGARWYRPGTATFTARDTVFGTLDTPISLNRYTYAWADPLGMFDPDGRDPGCRLGIEYRLCWASLYEQVRSSAATQTPSTGGPPSSLDALSTRETVDWVYVGPKFASPRDEALERLNGPQPPTLYDGMAAYPCGSAERCASDGLADWVTAGAKIQAISLAAVGVGYLALSCNAICLTLLGGPGAKLGQLAVDAASGDQVGNSISAGVSGAAGMADDILRGTADDVIRGTADDVIIRAPGVATNTVDDVIGAVCSFGGETRVLMADGTTKPISEVEVGDEVLAYDPETGERGPRKVTHLWVHQDALVDLEIGGAVVATTEDHPFWNDTERRWQRADALDAGDLVLTADGGRVQVGQLASESRSGTAYNLTVDDIHTYYVQAGDEEVLVHNTCPLSPNQMNQLIRKGSAPDGIVRVDIGKVTGEQTHAVFGRGAGAPSLNIDGTWKHGFVDLTRAQRDWLIANGWNL